MIILAILYIALAVMFIAFSLIVKLGIRKIKPIIERLNSNPIIRIEIIREKKSHI